MTTQSKDRDDDGRLTYREVVEILRLVEASAASGSFSLQTGNISVHLTRAGAAPAKNT
jgi:hypothetical protein